MPGRGKRFGWPVVVAAGVVLAGGGMAYAVSAGGHAPDYRTVAAGRGDVEQTLALTGLVDAAHRSDLAFGTDGTVSSVKVAPGDRVKAGQVIAMLETKTLDAAVTEAEATLAQAKAQLESDQDAQTSSVQDAASPGGSGQPSGGQPSGGQAGGAPDKETQELLAALKKQQQAVIDAQQTASAALAAAADALAAQTVACELAYGGGEPVPEGDLAAEEATDAADTACDTALADVQVKQAVVKEAQDALAHALEDLTATLAEALGSVSQQARTTQARTTQARITQAPSTQARTAADVPSGQTVTAARLAADQAQIDQAAADLVSAKAARAQAVLRSTRAGKVVSLDLAEGDRVSAGTAMAVVVGGDAVTLSGTVSETNVGKVVVGQIARVSVPGSSTTTEGTVTAIGLTADSSSGTTSYPVTITVEDPTIALPTGSRAQVSIVLATAEDQVTLPISAITRTGDGASSGATVRVWDGERLTRTPVTLAAIGSRTVAVADGVEEGDEVVLADADQAISGASDELNQRGGFGPGGGGPPVVFRQGGGGPTVSFGTR